MLIKAIETRYGGCRFRSRLEARWAVFFDALGVPWEYEPEGFDLGPVGRYLPDFRLPNFGAWFEVKKEPIGPRGEAWAKAMALAAQAPVIVAGGNLGSHELRLFCYDATDSSAGGPNDFEAELAWSDRAGLLLVAQGLRPSRVFCDPDLNELPWALNAYNLGPIPQSPALARAVSAGRSARFEYGE